MSEQERVTPSKVETREEGGADEPFLKRWSRLKADRASEAAVPAPLPDETTGPAEAEAQDADAPEALPPGDEDMPPLESLTEDSDFSAFLSPRVSATLRKQALRKLFRSPKFNVISELDDYIDDYRNFPALGDVLTSDMKHAAARLLEKQLRAEEAEGAEADSQEGAAPGAAPRAEPDAVAGAATEATDAERDENIGKSDRDDSEEPVRDA